ncbi:Cro/Cl family transcriptional regulator [Burkholderia territorii]|uniref:cable pilus major pilin CblA n=1 Tax=Burkholderia territorii TaxID=1503055 RepID=UPI000756F3A4|nr:cable pilus major pilin CblA [Burkholderia territorii]KWA15162.1 Cro/Cl family transcriptional regulator [Burkholderia territorii]KWA44825.1 Cro/Cl family transcriptional regulator [Burkholderia territorii]
MLKFVPIAAAALMSMSAHAVQKDITVTANVDTTLEMLSADGSALPTTMQMQYLPGSGLQPAVVNTKIFTNDKAKDLQIRLAAAPSMKNQTNPGADEIPLSVKLGETELTTTAATLKTAELFPGELAQGSNVLPLSIGQKTVEPVTASGNYQGLVSVIVTQSAASGG